MRDPSTEMQHLVSRGYQQNFANAEKRVAVIDARSGRLVASDRPIKSNFAAPGFITHLDATGEANGWLEREFGRVEKRALDQIRRITIGSRRPLELSAVVALMALHLVRSRAYAEFHDEILEQTRREEASILVGDPRLQTMHLKQLGMPATEESIQQLIDRWAADSVRTKSGLVESMSRQYNALAVKLSAFRVQVISARKLGSGFAIGDNPVVHADTTTGRIGFRDRLAIGDSNLIMAPLTRWTAAALSARHVPSVEVRTKKVLQRINAATIRGADAEVACHPDDAREVRRVCEHIADFPIERLLS